MTQLLKVVSGVSGGGGGDGAGLVTLSRMPALLTGSLSANGLTGEAGWGLHGRRRWVAEVAEEAEGGVRTARRSSRLTTDD